jgi:hypothetical protein
VTTGVAHARNLLENSPAGTASAWPRAAAVLARQDLEEALSAYWQRVAPGVRWMSMRVQLNCLSVYLPDEGAAADIAFTWHGLSRVTHHRPFELDPTKEELGWLVDGAQRGVESLSDL